MNKKISTKVALSVIIVLAFLVGVADYWLYSEIRDIKLIVSEFEIPEKETEVTYLLSEDSIKGDWETYTNEKYGFEIDYPIEWQFAEIDFPPTQSYIKPSFVVFFQKLVGGFICGFEVKVVDSKNSLFQEEIDALVASNFEKSDITLAGFPTTKLNSLEAKSCASYLIKKSENDYFRLDNYIMEGSSESGNILIYSGEVPECTEVFSRMLSDFKFID